MADKIQVKPATPDRWADLEYLMENHNQDQDCWCMFPRLKVSETVANGAKGNKAALKALVDGNRVPGLIAYIGKQAVGWVSVAPRAEYGRIDRSAIYKPIDDKPAFAIVCLLVHSDYRRQGVADAMVAAAVDYAKKNGAKAVEGYPAETKGKDRPARKLYTGTDEMFGKAGFKEVARHKANRPIFRKLV